MMTKCCWLFIVFMLVPMLSIAQHILSGNVVSSVTGNSVPYVMVYVEELKQGVMCDQNGNFSVNLRSGYYHIRFHSYGFKISQRIVNMKSNDEIRVELAPLAEAKQDKLLLQNQDSIAYSIIKQVMLLAPIYERAVESYQSNVYAKESVSISDLPFWLKLYKIAGYKLSSFLDKQYFKEWSYQVRYQDLNQYTEHVTGVRSSLPSGFSGFIPNADTKFTSNIYGSLGIGANDINPLTFDGLNYYDYKLENIEMREADTIYRISYTQKAGLGINSSGEIFVDGNHFNVRAVNKFTSILGGRIKYVVNILNTPVYKNLYLPSMRSQSMHINFLGLRADHDYNIFVNYQLVSPKKKLAAMLMKEDLLSMPENSLNLNQQFSRLRHRVTDALSQTKDPYLVGQQNSRQFRVSTDSLAFSRDDFYWFQHRAIPLTESERASWHTKDSLNQHAVPNNKEKDKYGSWRRIRHRILNGDSFDNIGGNKFFQFSYSGLFGIVRDYNYIDGLVLGGKTRFKYTPSRFFEFLVVPALGYGFKSNRPVWSIEASALFAPMRRGFADIVVGQGTPDRSGNTTETFRIINSISTILNGKGSALLMEERFITSHFAIDLYNGLRLQLNGSILEHCSRPPQRIWGIVQPSDYSIMLPKHHDKLAYEGHQLMNGNSPEEIYHRAYIVGGNFEFNPTPYYVVSKSGRKFYDMPGVRSPLFYLTYKMAIPRKNSFDSAYGMLDLKMMQSFNLSYNSKIDYSLQGGTFFNHQRVYPEDRMFLSTSSSLITTANQWEQFFSMPPYTVAANHYLIGRMRISASRILLNHIPIRWLRRGDEQFILKSYWDLNATPYFEVGMVKNTGAFSFGLFYGGHNFYQHTGFGFRVITNF